MRWKILGAHRARCTGGPRSASAAARSLKNAKRKRGSAQPQEREAQARQRAASRTRSASAAARSLKKLTAWEPSMNNTKNVSSAIFVIALVFGSWAGAGAQGEITLLAVGPMRVPTQKIVANFEAKTGQKVKVTYGNGVETRRMVAKGQALDVSLIIAPFPGAISSGAIVPGSATLVASILTAVGVPKGRPKPDISTPAAVKKALLAARSIGYEDPDFTVAGQGPLEALNKLGIADQVAAKSQVELGPGAQGISPAASNNVIKNFQAAGKWRYRYRHAHAQRHASRKGQIRHRRRSAAGDFFARSGCGIHLHSRKRPHGCQSAPPIPRLTRSRSDLERSRVRAASLSPVRQGEPVAILHGFPRQSEVKLQRELDDARLRVGCASRGRNLTKSSARDGRIRITEQCEIRQIEHFRPELQLTTLINVGDLGNAHIDIGPRWPAERIPSKSAVRALRRIVNGIKALSGCQYQIDS